MFSQQREYKVMGKQKESPTGSLLEPVGMIFEIMYIVISDQLR